MAYKPDLYNQHPYNTSFKDTSFKPPDLCFAKKTNNKYIYYEFESCLAYHSVLTKFIDFVSFSQLTRGPLEASKLNINFSFKLSCENVAEYIAKKYGWEYQGYCVFKKTAEKKFVWWDHAIICFDKGVYLIEKTQQILLEANGLILDESFYYMLNHDPCDIDILNIFIFKKHKNNLSI